MPSPDLDKLEAAIIFLPTSESKWQFQAMECFLTEEGHLAYFNQPTEWPYTKDKPRPIYIMVSAPALFAEVKRLRGELANAKAIGAAEELKRMLANLVTVQYDNGYRITAVPQAVIVDRIAEIKKQVK